MWLRLTEAYQDLQEMQEIEIQSWKIHLTIYWPFYDCDLLNVFRFTHSNDCIREASSARRRSARRLSAAAKNKLLDFYDVVHFPFTTEKSQSEGVVAVQRLPIPPPFLRCAKSMENLFSCNCCVFLAFPWRCHVLGERKFINVINNIYSFSGEEEGERKVYGIRNWNRQVWYLRYAIHGEV